MLRTLISILLCWILAGVQLAADVVVVGQPIAAAGYTAFATTFAGDGQCWMERDADLTGNTDSKALTVSFWIDFSADDEQWIWITGSSNFGIQLYKTAAGVMSIECKNAGGTTLVQLSQNTASVPALTAAQGWHHVAFSFDKSVETRRHLYIDGVSCLTVNTFTSDDVDGNTDNLDFANDDHAIGGIVGGALETSACISEFYISKSYVDLSNGANRALYYDAGGPPGDLSAVNSPIVYFKSVFSSFTVNSGSGGNFTKKGTTAFTSCTAP